MKIAAFEGQGGTRLGVIEGDQVVDWQVIFTGKPSGIGHPRKPPVLMKNGDICEVEIQGIGVLRNSIADE